MSEISKFEKTHNISFPSGYKEYYLVSNNHNYEPISIVYKGNDVFNLRRILTIDEISKVIDEFRDLLGYDLIPIAEMDYEDYLCFDFKNNQREPSVVYWNYELALENPDDATTLVFNDFQEFLDLLKSSRPNLNL